MSVYIPNIKLPVNCSKCRDTGLKFAIDALGLKCPERKEIYGPTEAERKGIRRSDCPLILIQEQHGRLGDLDKLEKELVFDYAYAAAKICRDAPTVIPAGE